MAIVASIWAFGVATRVIWLQGWKHDHYRAIAAARQEKHVDLPAKRGTLEDRDGRPLAISEDTASLGIIPRKIRDHAASLKLLSSLVGGIDTEAVTAKVLKRPKAGFLALKKHLEPKELAALRDFLAADAKANAKHPERRIEWISLRNTTRRIYLHGQTAAHVLGSVTLDPDEVATGLEGVERTFDKDLRGEPGFSLMLRDSHGREVESLEHLPPVPGKSVRLTIAIPLQQFADSRLARAVAETGAVSGAVVVMDPSNGELLALSSYPPFDPNVRPTFAADPTRAKTDPERLRRFNHAVSGSYDPGSVAKLFTFAIGVDRLQLHKNSWLPCGSIQIAKKTITDHGCSGGTRMELALAHSINVATINIGQQVGPERFEESLERFGFGQLTGIELPGESAGLLQASWQGSYLFHAFGYEYRVTPLQLARAVSAIANGGTLPNPTVVRWKTAASGTREIPERRPAAKAVSKSAALDVLNMSESVILAGTGREAKLQAYDAGGKTGTAKRLQNRAYVDEYNATFAGMIPLRGPKAVVIVALHRTRRDAAGTAAPAYRDVAQAAMMYLKVPPDRDLGPEPAELIPATPPKPPVRIPELLAEHPEPSTTPGRTAVLGRVVPDLRGKDKRAVAAMTLAMGIQTEFIGKGVAVHQFPLPGTFLASGQRVKVQFDR